jgi:hypothetical protein
MAEINNIFSTLPFLGRRISLITDDVDAEVTAIFDRLGELFLFVGENGRRVRDEVLTRQDDEPVINEIDDVAARVKAAQRDFVEAVRETTVALGTAKLKQINSSAAQTD